MSSLWAPPPPPTNLGRYRALSPNAAVHVSPMQLGAMSIGDKWEDIGMGSMNKESSFKLLDAYFDNGGNLLILRIIIRMSRQSSSWYTTNYKRRDPSIQQKILYVGNNAKSLHLSIDASLKKLRTSYIDLLYLHWWDYDTSIEEVMRALHTLVLQGKVLYLGISDTPAWVVSKANQYARDHALTPFVIYQGAWNVMERSFEREIIPMVRSEGMALAPWNVLAGGKIRTDAEEELRRQTGEKGRMLAGPNWERNEKEKKVCKALEKVADEIGAKHITSVAIAYLMQKAPFVFPIIGGRKVEHLLANVEALNIKITPEQIKFLESVVPFDAGFPSTMIGNGEEYSTLFSASGHATKQPFLQPIRP
ncbi:Aldo/keto reductase [Crucibulum laeve]|uniref:Aldo/keto reductase n=1 Tax=Crucibulum laeve TaxID=68775 RepID=A0A5C3M1H7_9AGAR|nr:Aldo/keto reductase [Crucibulum laeve]